MSFTEIIHWGVLTIAAVVGALYTWQAWGASSVDELTMPLLVSIIAMVAIAVVLTVAVAIPMAIRSNGTLADERDDAAEAGAVPWSFSVAVVGSMWAVSDILTRDVVDEVKTVNILLASVFTAVCVGSVVTLIRYRTSIR